MEREAFLLGEAFAASQMWLHSWALKVQLAEYAAPFARHQCEVQQPQLFQWIFSEHWGPI